MGRAMKRSEPQLRARGAAIVLIAWSDTFQGSAVRDQGSCSRLGGSDSVVCFGDYGSGIRV